MAQEMSPLGQGFAAQGSVLPSSSSGPDSSSDRAGSVAAQPLDISNTLVQPASGNNSSVAQMAAPANPVVQGRTSGIAAVAASAFEKFVAETTGRSIKPFGSSLFASRTIGGPNATVPGDYVLAPGDEILIYAWGSININYRTTIDRVGQIHIPRVGAFTVAGVRASDLQDTLRSQIGRYFTNFQLSASVNQIRGIQVYVVGQAHAPGLYSLPGATTLISAVFDVAQPGANGTYRHIQLKRNNRVIVELDLYAFMVNGDTAADTRLLSGDVIVIPPAGPRVAVIGAVDTPAIFELQRGQQTLDDVLRLSGVGRALSDTTRIQLERVSPSDAKAPRSVSQLSLAADVSRLPLTDGDILTVTEGKPAFSNAVTLRGNVMYPLRYAYKEGMRIADLIPDRDALITSDYYQRQNRLVQRLSDSAEADVSTGSSSSAQRQRVGRISVEVRNLLEEINWDYAVVERLDKNSLKPILLPFNLAKAIDAPNGPDNLILQSGDVVTVFSINDIAVAKSRRAAFVRISGEVKAPGMYAVEPGDTLRDLVRRAGGFTPDAFVFGAELRRESTRREQERRYSEALAQIEKDVLRSGATQMGNVVSADDASVRQMQADQQQRLLGRMRSFRPTGRVVLSISDKAGQVSDVPPIPLEDGDTLTVPSKPAAVNVFGSVFNEGAFLHLPDDTIGSLLARAGGPVKTADTSSIFVIRPNGIVVSAQQDRLRWLHSIADRPAYPGDTIIVPDDYERISALRLSKDLANIFGQMGLGVAAIRSLTR